VECEVTFGKLDLPRPVWKIVREMTRKRLPDGRRVYPVMYDGITDNIGNKEWTEYWNGKKKGTVGGRTGMSVEQVAQLHNKGMVGMR
jgi:hypothetical protein